MFKQKRLTVLSIAILLALLVAAVMPFAALADDSTPPPPDAPVVEEPSADAPTVDEPVTDAPAVDESPVDEPVTDAPAVDAPVMDAPAATTNDAPVATEEPTVANAPAATDTASDPVDEATGVAEVLDQLPADTSLVVLDTNGEALPLASDAAAQALASPDPYFDITVGGVTTTFRFFGGAGDCAAGGYVAYCFDGTATPIQDAIDFLSGNDLTPDEGKIYIDAGDYNENVTIDGSNWATTPGDLTLVGDGSATTTINGTFNLSNWTNAFWLQGFTINDEVRLEAGGDITVYDVTVDGSSSGGGLYISSGDTVSVGYSASNQSSSLGLYANAIGDIGISNSSFVNNTDDGAYLTSEAGNIYIENSKFEYNNGGYGAAASSSGDVTIFGSTFENNASDGAYLYSDAGSVYVENSVFSSNYGSGVTANSSGDLTLNSTLAEANFVDGAWLNSNSGHVFVENSGFNSNSGYGLAATSKTGDVVINNVIANGSGSDGMYLYAANIYIANSEALDNQGYSMEAEFGNYLEICDTTLASGQIVGCEAFWANEPVDEPEEKDSGAQPEIAEPVVEPMEVSANDLPEITLENLPAPLPEALADGSSFTFSGGFNAANIEIPEGGSVEITFSLPDGVNPANLTILLYNGTEWIELTDFVVLPDGTVQLTITIPGEIVFGQKP